MLLSLQSIDVAYGHAKALHNISLHLQEGELVFIVGINGAGKTTLLKTIAGFLRPSNGRMTFDQRDIIGIPPEEMAKLGVRYIFQDKRVFAKLTVKENLELAAHATHTKISDVIEELVNIHPKFEKLLDVKAKVLSGGERQILLITRSLMGHPRLLLIDEPTEGLSAGVIYQVLGLLQRMKGKISMLIVEQNLALVESLADRVYIMKEGKLYKEITGKRGIEYKEELRKYL